jgi:hypothetical protein
VLPIGIGRVITWQIGVICAYLVYHDPHESIDVSDDWIHSMGEENNRDS